MVGHHSVVHHRGVGVDGGSRGDAHGTRGVDGQVVAVLVGIGMVAVDPSLQLRVVAPPLGTLAEEKQFVVAAEEAVAVTVDNVDTQWMHVGGGGDAVVCRQHGAAAAVDSQAVDGDALQRRYVARGDAVYTLLLHAQFPPSAAAQHRVVLRRRSPAHEHHCHYEICLFVCHLLTLNSNNYLITSFFYFYCIQYNNNCYKKRATALPSTYHLLPWWEMVRRW